MLSKLPLSIGVARFRIRGLDSENAMTMINGVSMNKSYDGRPQWGNWGGLNDATRNQKFTIGTASDYTFGGILGLRKSIPALPFIEQEQELLFRPPIQL
jgi:hypothetical protein